MDAQYIEVINPANGETVGNIPNFTRADLDAAIGRARAAFPAWVRLSFTDRRGRLNDLADAIVSNLEELKALLTAEQGKPLAEAEMELMAAAYYTKGMAALDLPVAEHIDFTGQRVETLRTPIGVVGAITPWNFPIALAFFKIAPALLTGNTMVLKPSPFTPLTTARIVELAQSILPSGVLEIVTGGDQLGPWLTAHPGIDKVSFTGSTQTGRKVMASAAETLKRVTLELGGNDAAIVLPDVDIDDIVPKLFWGAFTNAGQLCIAIKRLYVHADVYEPLKAALLAYAATVKIGDGRNAGTQIGPLNNKAQFDRVRALVKDASDSGYIVHSVALDDDSSGLFIPVTFVDNPPETARIVQEEQFGPVLPLLRFDDIDDVVARANASPFGLGGSVWSRDEDKARAIARRLDAGVVWVNESGYLGPTTPFGGRKQSGIGVEGGIEALMEYTQSQTLMRPPVPA